MLGIIPKELQMHSLSKMIVRQWQWATPCSFEHWTELERVISRLSGRQNLFRKTWSLFLDCINNRQCPRITQYVQHLATDSPGSLDVHCPLFI